MTVSVYAVIIIYGTIVEIEIVTLYHKIFIVFGLSVLNLLPWIGSKAYSLSRFKIWPR